MPPFRGQYVIYAFPKNHVGVPTHHTFVRNIPVLGAFTEECLTILFRPMMEGRPGRPFQTDQEGDDVASHRAVKHKVPNIAGTQVSNPRHSHAYVISHATRTVVVSVLLAALAFVGTASAAVLVDINRTIENRSFTLLPQADGGDASDDSGVDDSLAGQTVNVLILGQDTRDGDNSTAIGGLGDTTGSIHNADTTIVAQIAADRSYINLVSIPRDSMVDVPSCSTANGVIPAQYHVQFNSIFANAYAYGGDLASAAGCTLNAVNALTGLNIQEAIVADFHGLSSMIDALGGVDICIPFDTQDPYTGLELQRGMRHLDGVQATQYARMRHGTGTDGSDIMRTTRQQYLIKALLNEALSKNLLTSSPQLYQLARAALGALNISDGLADAGTLAGLAMSLKDLDPAHVYAQTVPVIPDPENPAARVVWSYDADTVWEKLRTDQPLTAQTEDDGTTTDTTGIEDDATTDATDVDDPYGSADNSQSDGVVDPASEPDPNTGLVTVVDPNTLQETLIDPATGGTVDPETGSIVDPTTGQYIGMADQYIMFTFCGVS